MLKSILAGTGAVVVGKAAPDEWKRPVVKSIILPTHAETTQACSLSCAVIGDVNIGDTSLDAPAGGWQPGGVIRLQGFDCEADSAEIDSLTASISGPSDTDLIAVSISGNAQDDDDDGQGTNFDIESGATIDLGLDASDVGGIFGDESSVDLILTFSHPCAPDCVIQFQFNCED